jgi:DNA-binding SARP family transcriptional activator
MTLAVAEVPAHHDPAAVEDAMSPTSLTIAPPPAQPRAHKVYVVQPPHDRHYDSLWDIAARHLGDGRRYHEIYELNKGRPQPDGGELTRASLIQPGWVLLLPADATGPGVRDLEAGHDLGHAHHPPAQHAVAQPRPSRATVPTPPPSDAERPEQPLAPAQPDPPAAEQAPTLTPTATTDHEHGVPITPIAIGLGVGSLAALAALRRARRIALRRRPLGERPAPTPGHLQRVEAGLRVEARRVDPTAAAIRLAVALATQRGVDDDVQCVLRYDDGRTQLRFATAAPAPPPFTTVEGSWQLSADASGFTFAAEDNADPLPALLQLGRQHDADVYVDLEPVGYVAVGGDRTGVDDLLATSASRLVGAPWGSSMRVMVPTHVWPRVGSLDRVESVTDLNERVAELLTDVAPLRDQPDKGDEHRGARARRNRSGSAAPLLILVGWHAAELPDDLVQAALDPTVPLLILAAGTDPRARQQWRMSGDTLTGTDVDPVTVPRRPPAADEIPALIEHARTDPPVPADDPAYERLRQDAPAAEETAPPAMSVNVLGPVELHGVEFPDHGPRRTPPTRILVYLALHRRGVNAEQLSTALWPDEIADGRVVRNRVAEARALVAGGITNGPGWRLEDHVGCDWQLFQSLAAGSPVERVAALKLVRGQPFDGFGDEWVDVEMLRTDMVAAVVDLAADVAECALAEGDPALAFRAARSGLRASPYEERLYRLAMRAADAEGSTGKLHALMNELRRVLDVHVEPDDRIQRETVALYEELTSAVRRRERV